MDECLSNEMKWDWNEFKQNAQTNLDRLCDALDNLFAESNEEFQSI